VTIRMIFIILGASIVTYCTRFPLMVISGKWKIPSKLTKFMSFIAPAILTSLIVPTIFIGKGNIDISFDNKYLIASVITALAAYFSKNMLVAMITGITTVGILIYVL